MSYALVDKNEKEKLLFESVKENDLHTVKNLVRLETDIEARNLEYNETLLLLAVKYGHCEIAKWALGKSSRKNKICIYLHTLFIYIENGADISRTFSLLK